MPLELLQDWISAVNDDDLPRLLKMYAPEASLLPTFSPHVADTPEKIEKYFRQLASREHMSVSLHEKTVHSIPVKEKVHTIYGIYHFAFEIDDDLLSFASRFSFIVNLDNERPILHHHSSQIPRAIS